MKQSARDFAAHHLGEARLSEQQIKLVNRRQDRELLGRVGSASEAFVIRDPGDGRADMLLGSMAFGDLPGLPAIPQQQLADIDQPGY